MHMSDVWAKVDQEKLRRDLLIALLRVPRETRWQRWMSQLRAKRHALLGF